MRPGKNLITGVPPTKHKSHCNLCKDRFGLTSLPVFWNLVSHCNDFGVLSLSAYTVCPSGLTMYAGKKHTCIQLHTHTPVHVHVHVHMHIHIHIHVYIYNIIYLHL